MLMDIVIIYILLVLAFSRTDCALRLGLWMNGVTGDYADRIIYHHRTGKLRAIDNQREKHRS
jgi:hypothetical protein